MLAFGIDKQHIDIAIMIRVSMPILASSPKTLLISDPYSRHVVLENVIDTVVVIRKYFLWFWALKMLNPKPLMEY
jgi:hypothetical protein